jgi:hypothetical protein
MWGQDAECGDNVGYSGIRDSDRELRRRRIQKIGFNRTSKEYGVHLLQYNENGAKKNGIRSLYMYPPKAKLPIPVHKSQKLGDKNPSKVGMALGLRSTSTGLVTETKGI